MGRQKQKLYIGAVILFVVGMLLIGLLFELVYAGAESVPEISDGKTVSLTQEEQRYIEEHPEITVAMDTSWIPYCYSTRKTEEVVDGILPNLYELIASRVGFRVSYTAKSSYMDAISTVKTGKTMLVSGIANDSKMAEKNQVNITEPYIQIYYSAVTKQPTNHLYEEGKSYRVAVCTGSYATMAMKEKMPSYEFVDYKSNEECMNAVLTDEVDLALVATHSVDYYMGKHQYAELHTVMIDDFSWGLCIGVNQQCDPMLIQILNKGIASITANDMSQATTAGLVSASSNTKSIEDVIYSHPIIAIVFVSFIVALMLIILFLAIVRSRSRKQNKRLEEALTSAENANKFKSEFVSRISHDMRTPMNGILGLAELSKDEAQVDVLKQNMRKVGETGEYLLGLINDTLDFQKMESGKMTLENQVVLCYARWSAKGIQI